MNQALHVAWSFDYRAGRDYQTDAVIVTPSDDHGEAIRELRKVIEETGETDLHISRVQRLGPVMNEPFPRLVKRSA